MGFLVFDEILNDVIGIWWDFEWFHGNLMGFLVFDEILNDVIGIWWDFEWFHGNLMGFLVISREFDGVFNDLMEISMGLDGVW